MKMFVLVVRDRSTDSFQAPQFVLHVGAGLRSFGDAVNGGDPTFTAHPEDFDLYLCGNYDTESGLFDTHAPKQVAIGKDVVKS